LNTPSAAATLKINLRVPLFARQRTHLQQQALENCNGLSSFIFRFGGFQKEKLEDLDGFSVER
jgi:hypothetical protein